MRAAVGNPKLQQEFARWFRDNAGQDVRPESIGCTWCRGDRTTGRHWSHDCWILTCCVDRHGHDNCSQCSGFPCPRLKDWAGQNERYAAALDRLREMHGNRFD